MLICFPVPEDEGLESKVYGHFGFAPLFVLVDTDLQETKPLDKCDQDHICGACRPLKALDGEKVDAVVVSNIGAGALQGLSGAGLKVYQAQGVTIADNITCMEQIGLPEFSAEQACSAHGHGHIHGCSH